MLKSILWKLAIHIDPVKQKLLHTLLSLLSFLYLLIYRFIDQQKIHICLWDDDAPCIVII